MFFSKIIGIWRLTFEWKWIIWVLGVSFMVNILVTIVPIRETWLIWTGFLCRSIILVLLPYLLLLRYHLKWLVRNFICCWQLHSMWIYNLMLFFWIKSFLLRYDDCLIIFASIIFLLIICNHCFWVWIFDKSIWTSCSSSQWLASNWIYNI